MKEGNLKEGKEKWGVRELARILHRSPSHICRVLSGERKPSAEIRRKLRRRGIDLVVSRQSLVASDQRRLTTND